MTLKPVKLSKKLFMLAKALKLTSKSWKVTPTNKNMVKILTPVLLLLQEMLITLELLST